MQKKSGLQNVKELHVVVWLGKENYECQLPKTAEAIAGFLMKYRKQPADILMKSESGHLFLMACGDQITHCTDWRFLTEELIPVQTALQLEGKEPEEIKEATELTIEYYQERQEYEQQMW